MKGDEGGGEKRGIVAKINTCQGGNGGQKRERGWADTT